MSNINLTKDRNRVLIGRVGVDGTSTVSVLAEADFAIGNRHKLFIVTPNPEFVVFADKNLWFKNVLNSADIAIPDGVGLILAARLRGKKLKRITGVDLMEAMCKQAVEKNRKVYLLGGAPGAAKKIADNFGIKNLELRIRINKASQGNTFRMVGCNHSGSELGLSRSEILASEGFSNFLADEGGDLVMDEKTGEWSEKSEKTISDVVARINKFKPDYLFVAFGMGKQEKFIFDNLDKLNTKVAMGVGGAFEYLSGNIRRAPLFIRKVGFEWLFRLLIQPWRWKRQLGLLKFCCLALS